MAWAGMRRRRPMRRELMWSALRSAYMVVRPIDSRWAACSTVSRASPVSSDTGVVLVAGRGVGGGGVIRWSPIRYPAWGNCMGLGGVSQAKGSGAPNGTAGRRVAGCLLAAPLVGWRAVGPERNGGG